MPCGTAAPMRQPKQTLETWHPGTVMRSLIQRLSATCAWKTVSAGSLRHSFSSPHLERFAIDNCQDQSGKTIVRGVHLVGNAVDRRSIGTLQAPPQRVRQHLIGQIMNEQLFLREQNPLQALRAGERAAIRKRPRAIDFE